MWIDHFLFISKFRVPNKIYSDGGLEFIYSATSEFLKTWDMTHRLASVYYTMNGRAELAIKQTKLLLRSNIDASESLDNDSFLSAILHLKNTPNNDCQVSSA